MDMKLRNHYGDVLIKNLVSPLVSYIHLEQAEAGANSFREILIEINRHYFNPSYKMEVRGQLRSIQIPGYWLVKATYVG